mmetsp:Transcript_39939/g.109915  ORF Transcript_39939/g.109915 Transcript_39939/m.109915 type:complete len:387 (+) Transcript_39939:82-1242(+)
MSEVIELKVGHAESVLPQIASQLATGLTCLGCNCTSGEPKLKPQLLKLRPQEKIEDMYEIGEKLGEGSFGKVFACRDLKMAARNTGKLCVKVVPLQRRNMPRVAKLCDEERLEVLLRFTRMDHPNLVKYHGFVQSSDALYTVMVRCQGPDLVDYVAERGNVLPTDTIRVLALQILKALAAAHRLDIMHRDVKPENFRFLDVNATVLQLLDFGFAKPAPRTPAQHTVTGTLLYAAPELFDGIYSHSVDLWSAGVVLFQLFAGQPPFETSDVSILRSLHRDAVLMGDELFRGSCWTSTPLSARSLVRGLLTVDPLIRLSAAAACDHRWFTIQDDIEERPLRRSCSLRRCSNSITNLKRTYFAWNLADSASMDEPEAEPESFVARPVGT